MNFPIRNGIADFSILMKEKELLLSKEKWDEKYEKDAYRNPAKHLDQIERKLFDIGWSQIKRERSLKKGQLYLEIGCGDFYFGRALGKKGYTVVGIDFSYRALLLAKKALQATGIKNFLLVQGNLLNLPFKSNIFSLVVGFGVIEHFHDTSAAVLEFYRVLKRGGLSFNTVPFLNLGSLTYRQIWGNIPRIPVIEQLYSFFHMRILGARHMRFGYELSFPRGFLRNIHYQAGFTKVSINRFNCPLVFEYLPSKTLRSLATYLAIRFPLFWPMVYVAAKK